MSQILLITVHFHDGRYHGSGHWPPSPARLFQALVAGTARGGLNEDDQKALDWLESLEPPLVAAPSEKPGQAFGFFVPNNDFDAVGGDVHKIGKIRTAVKHMHPRLFDPEQPLLYAWTFEPSEENHTHASTMSQIAERLYQLGRGVDMAWATGEVIEFEELDRRLATYPGAVYRPCDGGEGTALDCPQQGSLDSLRKRHQAGGRRFTPTTQGGQLFTQAPKPRFRSVPYNSPTTRLLFDLRDTVKPGSPFAPWPLERVAELVQTLRGQIAADGVPQSGAAECLWNTLPDKRNEISRVLIGRNASDADKSRRIRILPLPSIGSVHVSRAIRRVLVEVPPNCPLRVDDIAWAFSGLTIESAADVSTGELFSCIGLVPADERSMLAHYGTVEREPSTVWRSVTPVALPQPARHRRVDPARLRQESRRDHAMLEETTSGSERLDEQQAAAGAIMQALRHAGVRTAVSSIRLQREPLEARGARAEAFASGTRFAKERLWHVEIVFATPVSGSLVLGDGRYCGLGLMHPSLRHVTGAHAFSIIDGLGERVEATELARALRRAVMSRVQSIHDNKKASLPLFFCGHESDGAPARRGGHAHLAFVPDLERRRLLIIAPHLIEHREPRSDEREYMALLERALIGFDELRAGRIGKLRLTPQTIHSETDPLFATSSVWTSQTPYLSTGHAKRNVMEFLCHDAATELERRGLPTATTIKPITASIVQDGRAQGGLKLEFKVAIPGPILLGHNLHFGGGCFTSTS